MYLPTFWKLTTEATMYRMKHVAGYGMPVGIFLVWVSKDSIYNWIFSTIIPPPRGVQKQNSWAAWDQGSTPWCKYSHTFIRHDCYLNENRENSVDFFDNNHCWVVIKTFILKPTNLKK